MAVTISPNPSDCELKTTFAPALNLPAVDRFGIRFCSTPIRMTGSVTLLGNHGDSAQNWEVGFIQAQWVETNWCSYRGKADTDGSIFVQRGRPPARTQQACRDNVEGSLFGEIFYNTKVGANEVASGSAGVSFPLVLRVEHFDSPAEYCPGTLQNTLTGKTNFLREVQLEFLFCTLLSVRDPAGTFRHMMGIYWNIRGQYRFEQPGNLPHVIPAGTGVNVSQPFRGAPNDRRFAWVLTSLAEARSCNDLAVATRDVFNPGSANRHESRVWANYAVTAR